jgi:hypothetical protein
MAVDVMLARVKIPHLLVVSRVLQGVKQIVILIIVRELMLLQMTFLCF